MKKRVFIFLFLPWIKVIAILFCRKGTCSGRWFEDGVLTGWLWIMRFFWFQKVLGFNRHVPFPCHHSATVAGVDNIVFHPDNLDNFLSPGVYWQAFAEKIHIGRGTYIAPNVGLITVNHDLYDLDKHVEGKPIWLGGNCWVGMNSTILPGVILGERTIVAAGSVVTKSFSEGNCVVAGVPARKIKNL